MNVKQDDFKEEVTVDGNVDLEGNVVHATEIEEEQLDEISQLKQQLEAAQNEAAECKKQHLRALADYQNLEKRVRDERTEIMKIAQANVISRLFPVLDNLRQAEIFVKDPGLKIVQDSFMQVLKDIGLQELQVEGKEYDPHVAEVVDVIEGDNDNMVVEVLSKGYEMNGRVLRPAQVRVSKKA